jgi:hypothetical protein
LGAAAAPPFLLGPAPSLKLEKNKRRNWCLLIRVKGSKTHQHKHEMVSV